MIDLDPSTGPLFDVAVIGAGDVGAAIARELARFDLQIALIDKGDVGAGTSKANTAILHTGFDCKPGTLEAKLVARGHALLQRYGAEVGIPIERVGATMVAWNRDQLDALDGVLSNAHQVGYRHARRLSLEDLYAREPSLAEGARGAVEIPDEFIVCPWTPPLAFATQAAMAGVAVMLRHHVVSLAPPRDATDSDWRVFFEDGSELRTRWLVNAGGLWSDELNRLAGHTTTEFTVTPRRGELIVFDKLARGLVNGVILPVPTGRTKGVLIAPTVFGNVMLGPTADDINDKNATATTEDGLARLLRLGRRLMPELVEHEVTASYSGLRAATDDADYQLGAEREERYAWTGGIRSTGLTASMAIAEWIRDALEDAGLELREHPAGLPPLRMPNLGEAFVRPYSDPELIAADSTYGEIVCFCERVSRGELRDALESPLPPIDLDGLRRRTRVTAGRCQGFYCGAHVGSILAEARHA